MLAEAADAAACKIHLQPVLLLPLLSQSSLCTLAHVMRINAFRRERENDWRESE